MSSFYPERSVLNCVVMIDADYIVNSYPNPSTNPAAPTIIDADAASVVAMNGSCLSSFGSRGLIVPAQPGDSINWFFLSRSNNTDSEIILYDILTSGTASMFSEVSFARLDALAVESFARCPAIAPALPNFPLWYMTAVVQQVGQADCQMKFTLYTSDPSSKLTPWGCFQWEPLIAIASREIHSLIAA